jgi:hypothetical protein
MTKTHLLTALTVAAVGLPACGGDSNGTVRTVTATAAETSPQESSAPVPGGDAILIETRVTNAQQHTGEVVSVSIGESSFCQGGKTSGESNGPTITTTLRCPGSTLKVQYAPTQRSLVQGAVWGIVSGTGRFKGLRGGGSMVAKFESDDPDAGREIFTGTVGK